jgi:DNA-binding NarL/FixJ family response regulator
MSANRPRVVLVEPHGALRAALRNVLEADGFAVCGEAGKALTGQRAVLREKPDVCLVGLRMDPATLRMIARIADEGQGTLTIVLTASQSSEQMIEAIRAGASGYLFKDMSPERIPASVRGVLSGEAAMPRKLAVRLIREIQRPGSGPTIRTEGGTMQLTPRQWEILNLSADGLSTVEVAERLMISPTTVRRHLSVAVSRLGVPDREAALGLVRADRRGA